MSESFEITLQELYRIKWYETCFHLLVACLSLADPITDIFTLVGFYRTDHVTWFSVGLVFDILPCLFIHFRTTFPRRVLLKETWMRL